MLPRIILVLATSLAAVAWAQDKPPASPKADPELRDEDASPSPAPDSKPTDEGDADPGKPAPAKAPAKAPADDAPLPPASKPTSADDEAALREALKTLAKALQQGRADGIRQVIHAANPTERKMVDAMASMAAQIAKLYKASAKAFGEEQAKALTGDVVAEMKRIDEADVSIDGDAATVRYKPGETEETPAGGEGEPTPAPPVPMLLRRVDGRWMVPMAELSRDATPEGIEQRLADLAAQTKVIADLTAEIAAGKHRTVERAAEAWQSKMMQALTPGRKPEADNGKKVADKAAGTGAKEKPPAKDSPKDPPPPEKRRD